MFTPFGFGDTCFFQGGVLPRIVFIRNLCLLLYDRAGAALLFALIHRIFVGHAVHRPVVPALKG